MFLRKVTRIIKLILTYIFYSKTTNINILKHFKSKWKKKEKKHDKQK